MIDCSFLVCGSDRWMRAFQIWATAKSTFMMLSPCSKTLLYHISWALSQLKTSDVESPISKVSRGGNSSAAAAAAFNWKAERKSICWKIHRNPHRFSRIQFMNKIVQKSAAAAQVWKSSLIADSFLFPRVESGREVWPHMFALPQSINEVVRYWFGYEWSASINGQLGAPTAAGRGHQSSPACGSGRLGSCAETFPPFPKNSEQSWISVS